MTRSKKENPSSSETGGASRRHNRRQALGLAGVAAAAAAVAAVGMNGGKKAQASHGSFNATSGSSNPAIHGDNTAHGPGVKGTSQGGSGVAGFSESGAGLQGQSESGTGVSGTSPEGVAVFGDSENGTGIVAFSHNWFGSAVYGVNVQPGPVSHDEQGIPIPNGSGPGLQGQSGTGVGVLGVSKSLAGVAGGSETGVGVFGGAPGPAPGVMAFSGGFPLPDGGLALDVVGKAAFSTAGEGAVPMGSSAANVEHPGVTGRSHITVTLTGDPGNAAAVVQWVERQPGSGFVVHLRVSVSNETPFTYLIVEPGA